MTTTVTADRRQQVAAAAYRMRHHVLTMGEAQGQGYVGQALGAADMLASVYADQLRYRPDDPHWEGRDRFLLSTGHYAIGLYAALAEAAMGASHHQLGNLTAMVDINALQADGPTAGILSIEPITDKWQACGWFVRRVDGNDVDALLTAFDDIAGQLNPVGKPSIILCDTTVGYGVPLLENREKAHFMRIDADEWQTCRDQLTQGHQGVFV
jgi:transketolase N-terminal domain/subunit